MSAYIIYTDVKTLVLVVVFQPLRSMVSSLMEITEMSEKSCVISEKAGLKLKAVKSGNRKIEAKCMMIKLTRS